MWTGSSASRADYTSLPTVEQVTKDIGYRPVLIDAFENGYCFKTGNIIKNSFNNRSKNSLTSIGTPLKKSLFCIKQYNIKCFYLF